MRPVEQASVSLAGFDLAAAFSEFLAAPAASMSATRPCFYFTRRAAIARRPI